jgi:hypothetical protein
MRLRLQHSLQFFFAAAAAYFGFRFGTYSCFHCGFWCSLREASVADSVAGSVAGSVAADDDEHGGDGGGGSGGGGGGGGDRTVINEYSII